MRNATRWPELLVGLERVEILDVVRSNDRVTVTIETTDTVMFCTACGARAVVKDRRAVSLVDLPAFGTPTRLVWRKRRWVCPHDGCGARSRMESRPDIAPARALLTTRAGVWATIAVGHEVRPVSRVAAELGVAWTTVMDTVRFWGDRLIADPYRIVGIGALGVDETKFRAGTKARRTSWITAVCDVTRRFVADVVEGRDGAVVEAWVDAQKPAVTGDVSVVVSDMSSAYGRALRSKFPDATYVVDRFHVVQAANRTLDETRRRVQQEQHGHRGRKNDPLYRSRKLGQIGEERLDKDSLTKFHELLAAGDPHGEVFEAWASKEAVRRTYELEAEDAGFWLDETIEAAKASPVAEVRRLGRMLKRWRTEILAFHITRLSNGPVEGLNSIIKKLKRIAAGFKSFENYRCRILLACGNINWQLLDPTHL